MNKENIQFIIVGLLGGLVVGFLFANSYMRNSLSAPAMALQSNSNMPAGHPEIGGQNLPSPEIQPAIDAAKSNPKDFEAQIKAADLLTQAEMYENSLEFLQVANKLKPEDYGTIVKLGNASFDSGKFEEAEKWYLAALAKKKDDANVRTDLGLTFIFRDTPNLDRAIQEFNTVLAANPNHIQALQNSIVAFIRKGDAGRAKENLAKLESVEPTNVAIPRFKEQIGKIGS